MKKLSVTQRGWQLREGTQREALRAAKTRLRMLEDDGLPVSALMGRFGVPKYTRDEAIAQQRRVVEQLTNNLRRR